MKIGHRVEGIFAMAAALEQSGRLRSTIYAIGRDVIIRNMDNTVLMHFPLRPEEPAFEHPVSFRASDYEGSGMDEKDGSVSFHTEQDGWTKVKTCSVPGESAQEMLDLFKSFKAPGPNKVAIDKGVLGLIDESLSHLELRGSGSDFYMVQRNIYSGALIEIRRQTTEGFDLAVEDSITEDFGPIGIRTPDFLAMFTLHDRLMFRFNGGDEDYCACSGNNQMYPMRVIIACCKYDELGTVGVVKK